MKWYVYWSKTKNMYQLGNDTDTLLATITWIAIFCNFDMAYKYVNQLNGTTLNNAYSRWTVNGK